MRLHKGRSYRIILHLCDKPDTAEQTFRKIVAFQGFPKPKYTFFDLKCIIIEAHVAEDNEDPLLSIECTDGKKVAVTKLQPEGRKVMDAKSFINGYKK